MADTSEIWACPNCGTSLDVSELGYYARVICPSCQQEDYVHTLIANFLIEGVLGIGGMSVVLRGRDIVLDRVVAIKLLNDTYKGEDARIVRFERECALMARVRHTNVVSIYSAGWENGQFYIAMEEVPGKNLEELLTDGFCMEENRAIEIISEVALGLDAAAQAGLLHRDMKPGNIILTETGQAKVLDFGLSMASNDNDEEDVIWATPFYVPPETLRREPEDVRTDIYALGMTLRHLLTGNDQYPYQVQSADDLLYCKEFLVPICQENRAISSDVGRLVDHMTAYLPDNRPANYVELLKEIGSTMEHIRKKQRISEYLRSKDFMLRAVTVLSCIIGGYVMADYGLGMFNKPETAIVQELPESHVDAARYETLCKLVEQKDWAGAYQSSIHLSRNASDPDLSAWASLYAWTLCHLHDELSSKLTEAKSLLRDQFKHLKEVEDPALPFHHDLICLKPLLGAHDDFIRVPNAYVLEHPMIDAMQLFYIADLYQKKNQKELATTYLEQARSLMAKSVAPFTMPFLPVADDSSTKSATSASVPVQLTAEKEPAVEEPAVQEPVVEEPAVQVPSAPIALDELADMKTVLSKYTFKQLFESLQKYAACADLTKDQMAKESVKMQICRACMAMVSFFEKKSAQSDWSQMSMLECLSKAADLQGNAYKQNVLEFKCMLALLAQKYDIVNDLNPYHDNSSSDEPFALLMKHWLSVLVN